MRDGLQVVGFSRSPYSHEQWRAELAESTKKFAGDEFDADAWNAFAAHVFYHAGDIGQADDFDGLADFLAELEGGADARASTTSPPRPVLRAGR